VELARRGAHLALSDVDEPGLADTAARCEGSGVKVTTSRVDVADRGAVHAWADEVVAQHGAVHLVVNNAGVALAATVESMSYEDFEWLMGIDFWGVVYGTKAFLPHLKAAGEGHLVNIASVFGLVSVPTQSAYNAAKFACGASPTRCVWSSSSRAHRCRARRCTPGESRRTSPATPAWTTASAACSATPMPTRPGRASTGLP
ncbi:MAG TPA: SDR family NAD(P)-dependent oxidoreductase, partial [Acidimicrobiales bacterium]|nr:SDR family NAD(P)-dependent oxidoreductase [Acidimicrobiales bacterium]